MMKQSTKQFRNVHPVRSSGKLLWEGAWGKEGGGNPPAPATLAGLAGWHSVALHGYPVPLGPPCCDFVPVAALLGSTPGKGAVGPVPAG